MIGINGMSDFDWPLAWKGMYAKAFVGIGFQAGAKRIFA